MRLASLCAILLAGTALAAGVASAARSSGDAAAVQKELAAAKTLQKKLEAATSPSRVKVSQQLGSCRGVQQPARPNASGC